MNNNDIRKFINQMKIKQENKRKESLEGIDFELDSERTSYEEEKKLVERQSKITDHRGGFGIPK